MATIWLVIIALVMVGLVAHWWDMIDVHFPIKQYPVIHIGGKIILACFIAPLFLFILVFLIFFSAAKENKK